MKELLFVVTTGGGGDAASTAVKVHFEEAGNFAAPQFRSLDGEVEPGGIGVHQEFAVVDTIGGTGNEKSGGRVNGKTAVVPRDKAGKGVAEAVLTGPQGV